MIPLTRPSIGDDDVEAVVAVLRSGALVQGKQVAAFEAAVAEHVRTTHAVAVSNCTAALQLSLLALDAAPGDLVVVSAYSWPATANVVELCGAQPVFVDIDPRTGNMCPQALAEVLRRVSQSPAMRARIRAIMPVHAFGQLADMSAIGEIARAYGIPVIEDAACALGAARDGRQAGAWGIMGCFSFHPRKAVTTGEGGIIVTDDAVLARVLRTLRNHGQDVDSDSVDPFVRPGFNCRLTDLQGALGVTQMAKLDRVIASRRAIAQWYDTLLSPALERTWYDPLGGAHVVQSLVVRLPADRAAHRSALIATLRSRGIEVQIGTWHMPLITYFRARYGFRSGDFPNADDLAARALTLPVYEGMRPDDVRFVVDTLHRELDLSPAGRGDA